jgi:hypothetical protein
MTYFPKVRHEIILFLRSWKLLLSKRLHTVLREHLAVKTCCVLGLLTVLLGSNTATYRTAQNVRRGREVGTRVTREVPG